MTENSSRLTETEQRGRHRAPFRGIAGLIEGSMMMLPEPGGGLSFRVLIGVDGEQTSVRRWSVTEPGGLAIWIRRFCCHATSAIARTP
jgi:hypothetical protein